MTSQEDILLAMAKRTLEALEVIDKACDVIESLAKEMEKYKKFLQEMRNGNTD